MEVMCFRQLLGLSLIALCGSAYSLQAQQKEIIYDNSTTYTGSLSDFKGEFGDQVDFAGENRTLSSFAIEFFVKYTIADFDETARVRLYANDGEQYSEFLDSRRPGTVLYDSGRFFVNPGFQTRTFDHLDIDVPDTVTFTIQFSGLDRAEEEYGLLIYTPPTVGNSFDDFWGRSATGWTLFDTPDIKDNYSARFTAIKTTVSQPKIIQTLQVGGDVEITANASVGKTYYLEVKDPVLGPIDWTPTGFAVKAASSLVTLTDLRTTLAPTRTYRVVTAFEHKMSDLKIDKQKKKVTITCSAEPGKVYALDAKSDLSDSWFRVMSNRKADGTNIVFEVNQNDDQPVRFYRIARYW
jgi:hypothetical protein